MQILLWDILVLPPVTWLTFWALLTHICINQVGQHWIRGWLAAWQHQAISWTMELDNIGSGNGLLPDITLTNFDFSWIKSFSSHISAISQEILRISITYHRIFVMEICPYRERWVLILKLGPGANEFPANIYITENECKLFSVLPLLLFHWLMEYTRYYLWSDQLGLPYLAICLHN